MDELKGLEKRSDELNEAGDFGPEAREVNQSLTQLEPSASRYWTRLARCFQEADDLDKAQFAYEEALRANPKSTVARNDLKRVQKRLEARLEVEEIFSLDGTEGLRARIKSDRDEPTRTQFRLEGRHLLYRQPESDVWDLIGLAREYGQAGEKETALRLYQKAEATGGESVPDAVNTGMAAVLRSVNQPKEAERLARKVLASDQTNAFAWNALAGALADQGRTEEAKEAKQAAWRLDQRRGSSHGVK